MHSTQKNETKYQSQNTSKIQSKKGRNKTESGIYTTYHSPGWVQIRKRMAGLNLFDWTKPQSL